MAHQCATRPDGEWDSRLISRITGDVIEDDVKIIEVDTVDASSGEFLGTHFPTGGMIKGRCRDNGGNSGHIEFDRRIREGRQTYIIHYEGNFIEVPGNRLRTRDGIFRKMLKGREALEKVDQALGEDEGTWIGEKPIT